MAGKSRGATWKRWDPHIHAPGTLFSDKFKGASAWEDYLTAIETSEPRVRALGVTDYYRLDLYEAVRAHKQKGRLADVELIFANVELRLDVGLPKGNAINIHLLISPEDADHVERAHEFLQGLSFGAHRCDKAGLIRLGKEHQRGLSDEKAYEEGAKQFKVSFGDLEQRWSESSWARQHIVIAVPGSNQDGTAGLQGDDGFAALRVRIERFAQVIFASQSAQRAFWLGQSGKASLDEIREKWNGPKPCLHGSDAHEQERVVAPALDRFCWLKGDVIFDTLRQACIEPELRAVVGTAPPSGAFVNQTIEELSMGAAPWFKSGDQPINSGLVAVIGARGSGKTALADLIAAGAQAQSKDPDNRSFIARAQKNKLLKGAKVTLKWANQEKSEQPIDNLDTDALFEPSRVQYLSQHFVDQLCSSEGENDALIAEIERVVYQAHPSGDRLGTTNFGELRDHRIEDARRKRERAEDLIGDLSEQIEEELAKRAGLAGLTKQGDDRKTQHKREIGERAAVLKRGKASDAARLGEVQSAIDRAQGRVEAAERRQRALRSIGAEVQNSKRVLIPEARERVRRHSVAAGLNAAKIKEFDLAFEGDVDAILKAAGDAASAALKAVTGEAVAPIDEAQPVPSPYFTANADLDQQPRSILNAEAERLRRLAGIDQDNAKQLERINTRIQQSEAAIAQLERRAKDAEGAIDRAKTLRERRRLAYTEVFEAIAEEEAELTALYAPLDKILKAKSGTLRRLRLAVERRVDVAQWAKAGEDLIDLRKSGDLKGKDAVSQAARTDLLDIWRTGKPADVAAAMSAFREKYQETLVNQATADRSDPSAWRDWIKNLSTWLYRTDHIRVVYGIEYDGVRIEQLSSGTRGIVLLLLYLALDTDDDRPLIIDQPEENLDPKSIYEELVPLFREAKNRRQIIIVTHNANLVVNTDADQVIVADCGPHMAGRLPDISYLSGGLERAEIRKLACAILEGGERAFTDRAKRLRFTM